MLPIILLATVGLALGLAKGEAADWPQLLGPRADGTSTETGLLSAWPSAEQSSLGGSAVGARPEQLRPIRRLPLGQAERQTNGGQQDDGEHTRLACAFRRPAETGLGEPPRPARGPRALPSPSPGGRGQGRGRKQPTIYRGFVHDCFTISFFYE